MIFAAKVGLDVVLLNPGHSANQIADAAAEQEVALVVADDDLADRLVRLSADVAGVGLDRDPRLHRRGRGHRRGAHRRRRWGPAAVPAARRPHDRPDVGHHRPASGRRTSGPKGLGPVNAIFSRIPLRAGSAR